MDPILTSFLIAAGVAISFLIIANIYIYVKHYNVPKSEDNYTQTVGTQFRTVSTHTTNTENNDKGTQFPEVRTILVEQGCDAQPVPYGAVITEQIQELRDIQVRLQDYMSNLYSRTNTDLERFTKEVLELAVTQCQTFQTHRDDLLARNDILKTDIQKIRKDTRTDLQKLQETIKYEVRSSTHNVIHQLLSIPPPPPPPPRPWLYLPYGPHTRSGEGYAERKEHQDQFWRRRRQMNEIAPEGEQEDGNSRKRYTSGRRSVARLVKYIQNIHI